MNKEKLQNRLQEAMDSRGLRAVDLVEKTGIPKGTLSYYLSGKTEPKSDRVYLLAQTLNVNEAWLLGYDVPMDRTADQKKNDQLAQLIVRMRMDDGFYKLVSDLAELDEEKYEPIRRLVAALK
jgi:transcriptional regulator with XRE-family HTH domain